MNSLDELLSEIRALRKENSELRKTNAALCKANGELHEKVLRLEEKLKLNSKNSSKPPSSDQKPSKEAPKKGGAKPGHPGHFRPLFSQEQVDSFVDLKASGCPTCGGAVRPSGAPPPRFINK